jgi:hypothetical protein
MSPGQLPQVRGVKSTAVSVHHMLNYMMLFHILDSQINEWAEFYARGEVYNFQYAGKYQISLNSCS